MRKERFGIWKKWMRSEFGSQVRGQLIKEESFKFEQRYLRGFDEEWPCTVTKNRWATGRTTREETRVHRKIYWTTKRG